MANASTPSEMLYCKSSLSKPSTTTLNINANTKELSIPATKPPQAYFLIYPSELFSKNASMIPTTKKASKPSRNAIINEASILELEPHR